MTILITGAAGLNGTTTVHEFARHGEPIRALVRSRAQARELDEIPIVELVEGDLALPETLGPALDGVDRVLLISSTNPQMAETQCTFIDAAKKAGVGHVVKVSGLNAAVDSAFRFTRMHGEIERHLERSGLAWTHLRPSQFMQVYFREVHTIVNEDAFYLPMGHERLAPVDVADIAKVAPPRSPNSPPATRPCSREGPAQQTEPDRDPPGRRQFGLPGGGQARRAVAQDR
jgi:uncharacterized protein YbjT (DUF2867 family)